MDTHPHRASTRTDTSALTDTVPVRMVRVANYASLNASSERSEVWEEMSSWLGAHSATWDPWVVFEHVEPGLDISVPDECLDFVVQRPAGAPFTNGDYEALRAAFLRRENELRAL
ncbi:hypothetical protein [Variovorax sp. GT1P44]|uniref:hypothetical protein n=1 Tax=Variovorax sp. GT1P44 TaxID=3443742 RepID=UPI003F447C22